MPRTRRSSRQALTCPQCGALINPAVAGRGAGDAHEPLSRAQLRVLTLLNRGLTTSEIAHSLDIGVGTVRWHLNHIFEKLRVRNRTQAIVKARELRLL
jgi:LuxR family transcriptional regulator, maltose regulon positive regulatory protein